MYYELKIQYNNSLFKKLIQFNEIIFAQDGEVIDHIWLIKDHHKPYGKSTSK